MRYYDGWRTEYLRVVARYRSDAESRNEKGTFKLRSNWQYLGLLGVAITSFFIVLFYPRMNGLTIVYASRAQLNIRKKAEDLINEKSHRIKFSELSPSAVLSGISAIELEILHLLIIGSERSWLARCGAWVLFHLVWFSRGKYSRARHLILHHHYGRCMLIAQFAKLHEPLRVATLPHGLMNLKWMREVRQFPGIETKFCAALNREHANAISIIKERADVHVFGPCKELIFRQPTGDVQELVFISSGVDKYTDYGQVVRHLKSLARELNLTFSFRPHPHEVFENLDLPAGLRLSHGNIFDAGNRFIAIGFASTLLIELSYIGVQTVWLEGATYADFMIYGDARRPIDLINSVGVDWRSINKEALIAFLRKRVVDPELPPFLARVKSYSDLIGVKEC